MYLNFLKYKMEVIVIDQIPYRKISQNDYLGNYNRCNRCNGFTYNNRCGRCDGINTDGRRGAVICILVILIIIVIIIIGYVFYNTSSNVNINNFKNKFKASPEANRDYETVQKLLTSNPKLNYSAAKTIMGDNIDIAKFDKIIKNKDHLTPEYFDNI